MAQYKKNQYINYDSYIDINGYRWLSYISFSGVRRYVAQRSLDKKRTFVKGGV
jgi:phage tail sheath gpL-like